MKARKIHINQKELKDRIKYDPNTGHKDLFKAVIQKDGIPYYLGCFGTLHDARTEYQQKSIELHGKFRREV